MSLYTRKEIHVDDWIQLPIENEVVKRVEELSKIEKQPTFDQYPMFEWPSGINILVDMTGNKGEGSY